MAAAAGASARVDQGAADLVAGHLGQVAVGHHHVVVVQGQAFQGGGAGGRGGPLCVAPVAPLK